MRRALIHAAYRTPFIRGDSFLKLDKAKKRGKQARRLGGSESQ
jgi:hypothetical protein